MTKIEEIVNSITLFFDKYITKDNVNNSKYEIYNTWIKKSKIQPYTEKEITFALTFIANMQKRIRNQLAKKGVIN